MHEKYNEPVKDPVCGKMITPETAETTAEYEGRTYFFDSVLCKEDFISHPERYVHQDQEHRH